MYFIIIITNQIIFFIYVFYIYVFIYILYFKVYNYDSSHDDTKSLDQYLTKIYSSDTLLFSPSNFTSATQTFKVNNSYSSPGVSVELLPVTTYDVYFHSMVYDEIDR